MSSRHLVDPTLRPLLDAFPTVNLTDETLAVLRNREIAMLPPIEPNSVSLEVRQIEGPEGHALNLHIYLPSDAARRPLSCIYHIHGGGYVAGSPAQNEFFLRPMSEELGCAIVSVDYRLAPENPHPAPVEDCFAGLAWTFDSAAALDIDRSRIGVMGESAGGGLAAALALLARDRGLAALAFQLLTYPMLDDRTCTGPKHPTAGEFIWTPDNNRFGWRALLGVDPGSHDVSSYAAAARAEDLTGLPPTFISTGALDLFADENLTYAQKLMKAGVPVELHLYPGAFHGFDLLPIAPVSLQARADRMAALKRFTDG